MNRRGFILGLPAIAAALTTLPDCKLLGPLLAPKITTLEKLMSGLSRNIQTGRQRFGAIRMSSPTDMAEISKKIRYLHDMRLHDVRMVPFE